MLANFLGKSKPINFIILLSLFIGVFIGTSFSLFENTPFDLYLLFKILFFIGFNLVTFFFYNFVVTKNNLTLDNFYAFFTFTILLSYFTGITSNLKTLTILLLYVIFLRKIYSLKSKKNTLSKLFDSGFWLSILFLLEPFSAIFGLLIYTAIFLHKKAIVNNLIAPIIGFITPLIIYFTYCFWFDKLYVFTNLFYFDTFYSFIFNLENRYHWILVLILTLSVMAIFLKSPKAFSVNNSFKKSWILLIINLVVALFFTFFIPNKNDTELLFLLFPAAIIIANGLESVPSNLIKNIVFALFIASAIILPFTL
jgi:hypothetical protein